MARSLIQRAQAGSALVEHALVGGRHCHDARRVAGVDTLAQHAVDLAPRGLRARAPVTETDRAGGGGNGSGALQQVTARGHGRIPRAASCQED